MRTQRCWLAAKCWSYAIDLGFSKLIIEGDNESVMKSIAGSRPSLSRLGHLYADIQCIALGLHSVFITCGHRDANSVAHSLADMLEA